ncbi:MAG: exodeoxyribonuclease VII small subunit [Clostridia bacterium]|nr:exodeoxyribonuclease VII small subunit [Clostridia bacterium]
MNNLENKLTFEQCISKLEEIASKLENGETTLEESISLYEEGMKLSKQCSDILKNAKQKIVALTSLEEEEND